MVELSSLAPFDSQTAHSLVLLHSLLLLFEECFVKVRFIFFYGICRLLILQVYEIDSGLLLGDVALPSAPLIVPRPLLPSTVSSTWTAFTGFLTQLGLTEIRPPQITTIAEHLANAVRARSRDWSNSRVHRAMSTSSWSQTFAAYGT